MSKISYKIASTSEEFAAYSHAYSLATNNELKIDVNFLSNAFKVVYIVFEDNPSLIIGGFVINTRCDTNCRYLAMVSEAEKAKCLQELITRKIFITDLVECVAIFATKKVNTLERIIFFLKAILACKNSGKRTTLAGSYISQFRKSLQSVYHDSLFEGKANNGKYFGLYFGGNKGVIANLVLAVPRYLFVRFNHQILKRLSKLVRLP